MLHHDFNAHLRIARPVSNLEHAAAMFKDGLGLSELGNFENHDGFDGIMLGNPGTGFHLEFTRCRTHPVPPKSTPEDLLVFYVSTTAEWEKVRARLLEVEFKQVQSYNPYWEQLR